MNKASLTEKFALNHANTMKHLLLAVLTAFLLAACRTPDHTGGQPGTCEVHHVAMFKRAVPFSHGLIPMNPAEDKSGEWKRRMDHYPHPGDFEPATGIVMPGEAKRVVVYVCKRCEAARKQAETPKP